MNEGQNPNQHPHQNRPSRSYFWPLMLISLGVVLLLSNLGVIPGSAWNLLWRFWPVILIAIGIDVIIGRRSPAGALVSAFLILILIGGAVGAALLAPEISFLNDYTKEVTWETASIEQPLEEYHAASVLIDWTSPGGQLSALEDSGNLLEGDLSYRGELIFKVGSEGDRAKVRVGSRSRGFWLSPPGPAGNPAPWDIALSPRIPLYLTLDSGSGSCQYDLSELQLENLIVDSGSGSISLDLPDGNSYAAVLDSGSGSVRISLPEDLGARITLDAGSGSFRPGDRFQLISGERRGDGVWETKNFSRAEHSLELKIDQGSGSITLQ